MLAYARLAKEYGAFRGQPDQACDSQQQTGGSSECEDAAHYVDGTFDASCKSLPPRFPAQLGVQIEIDRGTGVFGVFGEKMKCEGQGEMFQLWRIGSHGLGGAPLEGREHLAPVDIAD